MNEKMTKFRWVICSMLLVATTVNYLDRQVLSLTWKDFIAPEFHWNDAHYGTITGYFSLVYAICMLFAGKVIDWLGTKKGYMWAIFIWSLAACAHAFCGWATVQCVDGVQTVAELGKTGGAVALSVASISVWFFLGCRYALGLGEAGNFPAAIKVTAEYFPKKDRAFATSIFNSGASVGALAAPALVPPLAEHLGWEMAFIIIGALGFIWLGFWAFLYNKPTESRFVNAAELAYMTQDDAETASTATVAQKEGKTGSFWKCFTYRQTWSFAFGKFMTDGVWWFFLFWAPGYFSDQFGYKSSSGTGMMLIIVLYAIVTFLSIYGCKLPTYLVEKRGMNPYEGRMLAMLLFAFFPLVALFAQPLGAYSAWWPAILIGIAAAAHQAWSANIFSTTGDMFPRSRIATVTGIGGMAGGLGGFVINYFAGQLFKFAAGSFKFKDTVFELSRDWIAKAFVPADVTVKAGANAQDIISAIQAAGQQVPDVITATSQVGVDAGSMLAAVQNVPGVEIIQQPWAAMGYVGKPAGYMVVFCFCAVAYLIAWFVMKSLVPRYSPIKE